MNNKLEADRAAYLAAFPDVHFRGAWTARNEQDFAVWLAARRAAPVPDTGIPTAGEVEKAARDAAELMWNEAPSQAGFYVAGHCANGERHAEIIMEMPMPELNFRAPVSGTPISGGVEKTGKRFFNFNVLPTMTKQQEVTAERGYCPACGAPGLCEVGQAEGMRFCQCDHCKDIVVLAGPSEAKAGEPKQ